MTTLKWDASKPVARNAADHLPELARQFFASGREAGQSFAALHRFRLMTKRFRYILEMFHPYYGPDLERRLDELQKLQQLLGEISDISATQDLLAPREDLPAPERDRLLRKLTRIADSKVAAFRRHWREKFAPPAREKEWIAYLKSRTS